MMYRGYAGVDERTQATLAGQVFGLLGFSMVFTMGGALLAPRLGPGAFWISLIGSFGCLIALFFLKDKSPINLGLFYAFSVAEGLLLGIVVEQYFAAAPRYGAGDRRHERRLARAVRSEQYHGFSGRHLERYALQNRRSAVACRQVIEPQHGYYPGKRP